MYNNVFQDYINNIIGNNYREETNFENSAILSLNQYNNFQSQVSTELEQFYPESYKLIYPMVRTACMRNTKPITDETIEEMVQEIYLNFNGDDITEELTETRGSQRSQNKFAINDLIKILLIRELLGRPGNVPPFRPGFPGPGPGNIPPFRPGITPPPGPSGRPPFRPRNSNFDS